MFEDVVFVEILPNCFDFISLLQRTCKKLIVMKSIIEHTFSLFKFINILRQFLQMVLSLLFKHILSDLILNFLMAEDLHWRRSIKFIGVLNLFVILSAHRKKAYTRLYGVPVSSYQVLGDVWASASTGSCFTMAYCVVVLRFVYLNWLLSETAA